MHQTCSLPVAHMRSELVGSHGEKLRSVVDSCHPNATSGQTTAGGAALVEHDHLMTGIDQVACSEQSGQTGTNDDDLHAGNLPGDCFAISLQKDTKGVAVPPLSGVLSPRC